jgi:hypothetical protein
MKTSLVQTPLTKKKRPEPQRVGAGVVGGMKLAIGLGVGLGVGLGLQVSTKLQPPLL